MATSTVLVATDLTPISDAAIARGAGHAQALGARLVVCHVIPDVIRSHPLLPSVRANEATLTADLEKRAAELVTEQVRRVAGVSPDDETVMIEVGNAEDEIVRIAEEEKPSLVVVGHQDGGTTAERVVRYAHSSVLVARAHAATKKVLVATDFSEPSLLALATAKMLVETVGVEATLLHVMTPPSALLAAATSPFGSPIVPPDATTLGRLSDLGKETLAGLAKTHLIQHHEQVEGEPVTTILARAKALDAEMIIMGSRGHTGLTRLVLGSTAERVVHSAPCSVLIAR